MSTVTLTTLRALARERADQVSSAFVADAATGLDRWINEGLSILHSKLIEAYGNDYKESTAALNLVSGTSDYALPADFSKLLGVDINFGGRIYNMLPYNQAERNSFRNALSPLLRGPRYKLAGNFLRVLPATLTTTGSLIYAPAFTQLVAPGDSVTFPEMWETYGIVYAARELMAKEESSVRELTARLMEMDRELASLKENRDAANPSQTVDVESRGELYWPY